MSRYIHSQQATNKAFENLDFSDVGTIKTLIIRYGRYEEYTEPFNGEIYWKAFSFYQRI